MRPFSRWSVLVALLAAVPLAGCKKSEEAAVPPPASAAEAPAAPAEDAAAAAPAAEQPAAAAPEPAPQQAPQRQVVLAPTGASLPGAADVQAALARRDYGAAVAALTRVKMSVPPDQRLEYNTLMRDVRSAIVDAMATDANAKRAFDAMRVIEAGR